MLLPSLGTRAATCSALWQHPPAASISSRAGNCSVVVLSLRRRISQEGQNDVQTDSFLYSMPSLLDLLLWIPRSCQLCGGKNYEFPFSYHLFSTRFALPCLTYLGCAYGAGIWVLALDELAQLSFYFTETCTVNIADCRLWERGNYLRPCFYIV